MLPVMVHVCRSCSLWKENNEFDSQLDYII